MSGDFELCPKCKQGHLYPEGRAGVDLEAKGDFRETACLHITQPSITIMYDN